jgi:hypothetical protein
LRLSLKTLIAPIKPLPKSGTWKNTLNPPAPMIAPGLYTFWVVKKLKDY